MVEKGFEVFLIIFFNQFKKKIIMSVSLYELVLIQKFYTELIWLL